MEQNKRPTFTIFTATYNRAALLPRLYESLMEQSFKDFEWVIVDDGSSDKTGKIVENWQAEKKLLIKYFYQPNQGKHAAINRGVKEALGELFLMIDSDDRCFPYSLAKLFSAWQNASPETREACAGAMSLCQDDSGNTIGTKFPEKIETASMTDIYYQLKTTGDKWGFFKTEILKKYPFPIFEGENFLTEAIVWDKIAKKYQMLLINEPLLLVEYQPDGLSQKSLALRIKNPKGACAYYLNFLELKVPLIYKFKNLLNYGRFSGYADQQLKKQLSPLPTLLWQAAFVVLYPLILAIRIRDRKSAAI